LLDIKLVRESPEVVKESLRKRGLTEKLGQVDLLLRLDAEWRRLQAEADQLRKRRNEVTAAIAEARKKKQDATALMKKPRQSRRRSKASKQESMRKERGR